MKRFSLKSFIVGVLTTILVTTMINTVFAEQISKTITATYNSIKITIDGKQIEPKDTNGNIVEPFVSGGTTYLPVRSIAEAVGYDVVWDSNTSTVKLTKKITVTLKEVEFTAGKYIVGEDIAAGTYNIVWVSGMGNLIIYNSNERLGVNEVLGDGAYQTKEYKNATLEINGTVEVKGTLKVKFVPKGSTNTSTTKPQSTTVAPTASITTQAPTTTPPATQAQTKANIIYYKEYPSVPDFGEFSGIELRLNSSKLGNIGLYLYEPCSQKIVDDYITLLKDCGFAYDSTEEDGEVYYKKGKILISASTDDVFTTIGIIEL